MTAALPVSVAPRPGESIESWLEHLADANGLTTAQLLNVVRGSAASTRYLTVAPSPETLARLATIARVDPAAVQAATLAAFDGTAIDLNRLDPHDRNSYRQVAARGWTPAQGTQICPACLAETGVWQSAWRLLIVTTCTRHGMVLVEDCPSCGRPFRDQRHSHLRRVGAALVCGNPLGQGPLKQCQQDLSTINPPSATPALLATQERIDEALAGGRVTVLGTPAEPAAYLSDLRYLTTLLLHLAGQPGANELAPWIADLAGVTAHRTSTRGPRWGMLPPTDPRLRGQVLATADAILTAADLDIAAGMFTPWTELTPSTNDGPIGWLADRTVMTPTLTRLVMAARAPHRRLSHHLDTPLKGGARVPINLVVIPQVLPHQQYLEYLDRAFDSREATVRLFASLSLARLYPEVRSWAAAAEALNMPGPMGVRCARACSATMLVTADEWEARIWQAIHDVRGSDFRAVEAKIHHRHGLGRWFNEWARQHRPGTHPSSNDLGLTWQWVHVAHAHLDLSPAWRDNRPQAKDRARYRQFEHSLDEYQQSELAHALHMRA